MCIKGFLLNRLRVDATREKIAVHASTDRNCTEATVRQRGTPNNSQVHCGYGSGRIINIMQTQEKEVY